MVAHRDILRVANAADKIFLLTHPIKKKSIIPIII